MDAELREFAYFERAPNTAKAHLSLKAAPLPRQAETVYIVTNIVIALILTQLNIITKGIINFLF